MKAAREEMDIVNAYAELGSYRAAAEVCGTTHKTVKRVVERCQERGIGMKAPRAHNTDAVEELIAERIRRSDGRISAKRLLPIAQAAGYQGSARNFRRAVAEAKSAWRRERRVYRPWIATPGEHLVIDWGEECGMHMLCAVLPWSRYRFVRFAADQKRTSTLSLLSECFEDLGGVPAVVLADRMACLKMSTVAGVVVPHPEYVRFAAHFGFRPDFCEAADPESKGVVERLVGYAQSDLIIPAATKGGWERLSQANEAARAWCQEVNGRVHSEIAAMPAERLLVERRVLRPLPAMRPSLTAGVQRKVDKLSTVRFGSARYSVPVRYKGQTVQVVAKEGEIIIVHEGAEVSRHPLKAPGEVSINDSDYGGERKLPSRAVRPRSQSELAFLALAPVAEEFLRAAAAAGTANLPGELSQIVALEPAWGKARLVAALERALAFHRYKAADVRAILAAAGGLPHVVRAGSSFGEPVAAVPTRPLSAYALEGLR